MLIVFYATLRLQSHNRFVKKALRLKPGVAIVTSYEGLKALQSVLLPHPWDVAVLDEGQRIRNPDAEVTLLCKQIRTAARLVLTGKSLSLGNCYF
jgi:SNF2 family DNA or RNA helicase